MQKTTGIVWFRNDLRLKDNRILNAALAECGQIIPLFIIDTRWFRNLSLGFKKTGHLRAMFLLQCLQDLKQNLQSKGGDLLVLQGYPEEILPEVARHHQVQQVYASKETTWEEIKVEEALEVQMKDLSIPIRYAWQHTLILPDDLPFEIYEIPDVFSDFRKEVEKKSTVKEPLQAANKISIPENWQQTELPSLSKLGFDQEKVELRFNGGETEAWKRLNSYFWQRDLLKNYKFTRNGLLGEDYSSKLSPWLAHGCISPRSVYQQVKIYEKEHKSNISTYWMIFELYWRDYFRFVAAKYGNKIFFKTGLLDKPTGLRDDLDLFQKWANGATGIPFIDANMLELNQTGFMSNRGRQNVSSFLVKDLQINWTWGAAYFESKLIDYDVTSNWANWAYIAGVGNDPRQNRYFNIMKQAQQYDPKGEFVKHWLPQLKNLENAYVHCPTLLADDQLQEAGIRIGENYPKNLVPFRKWLK